jgi:hypothetical protein
LSGVNDDINEVNDYINTQSKGKESEVKESKLHETKVKCSKENKSEVNAADKWETMMIGSIG